MVHLDIVTPDRFFFSEDVEMVIVRGIEGDIGILKDRAPITTPLRIGKIRIFQDKKERVASVVEGYVSVLDNVVTVVTDAAEWPDEIDVERAEEAKKRAEERLKSKKEGIDVLRAELALKRAINRLNISKMR